MSELSVLDRDLGDLRVHWDQHNDDQVGIARRTFEDMKSKGYLAYKLDRRGVSTGDLIREFDPTAEQIIMSPQPVGG